MHRGRIITALVAAVALTACGAPATQVHGGRPHAVGFGRPPRGDYGLSRFSFTALPSLAGYDAVTLSNIPRGPAVVGCYVSGRFVNCGAARVDFPRARLVTIATFAGAAARCLDVERGDAVPSQTPGWIRWMLRLHVFKPCIYSDASEMGSVRANLAGIPRGEYALWLADWDGRSAVPSGFDAKQWFSNCCVDRDTFLLSFFVAPKPPLKCFGVHAQVHNLTCIRVRREVARWTRARASSRRAFVVRGCPGIEGRQAWFARQLRLHPHSLRAPRWRRALGASRRARRRESCDVFAQRQHFFTLRINSTLRAF